MSAAASALDFALARRAAHRNRVGEQTFRRDRVPAIGAYAECALGQSRLRRFNRAKFLQGHGLEVESGPSQAQMSGPDVRPRCSLAAGFAAEFRGRSMIVAIVRVCAVAMRCVAPGGEMPPGNSGSQHGKQITTHTDTRFSRRASPLGDLAAGMFLSCPESCCMDAGKCRIHVLWRRIPRDGSKVLHYDPFDHRHSRQGDGDEGLQPGSATQQP